jgi:hypothetical protein
MSRKGNVVLGGLIVCFSVSAKLYASCSSQCTPARASGCAPRSYYGIRSAGANTARELVGWQEYIYSEHVGKNYFATALAAEYQQSFKPERIANYLFGTDQLRFVGSKAPGRNDREGNQLVAENFGLPATCDQTLFIKPKIQNYILDFELFGGLNRLFNGFYLRLHAPLVLSKWSLFDYCGRKEVSYSQSYSALAEQDPFFVSNSHAPAGAFGIVPAANGSVLDPVPINSTLCQALSGEPFGDMKQRWQFGKFNFHSTSLCRLADIDLMLGWNYWDATDSHLGGFVLFVAPTGNKVDPEFIFSPVIGNGQHYELGGGLTAHSRLWQGLGDQHLSIYLEGNVTHLFKNIQIRSFDFKQNGLMSRYLLLKEIDTVSNITNAYTGNLINAIDITTRQAAVRIPVKGDASLKLAYRNNGFLFDIGYNLYGLAQEKLCIQQGNPCASSAFRPNVRYVIQGLQPTQGFSACAGSPLTTTPQVVNINASNSAATMYKAVTQPTGNETVLEVVPGAAQLTAIGSVAANPAAGNTLGQGINLVACASTAGLVLNPAGALAYGATGVVASGIANYTATATINDQPIDGSFSYNDTAILDTRSGAAKAIVTQKIFGFIGYTAPADRGFIGVGGEVEFDGNGASRGGHNQWGVWLKGGLSF